MLRQGYLIAVITLAVLVAVLYLSPAFAPPPPDHNGHKKIVGNTAGVPDFVKVKAGTPVTVLGLSKPGNRPCPECPIDAVVQLPNGDMVVMQPKAINYQTQTVRVDTNASGPYSPKT